MGSLEHEAVAGFLTGRFGQPYLYVDSCPSTQDLLAEDAPEGAVAATDLQSSGRGRQGRTWEAPAGAALLCSIALRPPPGARVPELTLVGALAVAQAVEKAAGAPVAIKWPNDVLLDGRKVAGILGELRDTLVVLGIGVNVNQAAGDLPPGARTPAISIRAVSGSTHDRAALLGSLLARLETAYDRWLEGGLAILLEEIELRDALRGREVEVAGRRGVAVGINVEGRLVLEVGGERIAVSSGEVTV